MTTTAKRRKPTPKQKTEIAEIKKLLDNEEALLEKIKEAKEKAVAYISKGLPIEGYDVEQNFGNRKWIKGVTAKKLFAKFKRFFGEEIENLYKPQDLKSPAQIETYFIEDKKAKEKLQAFISREDKGLKLVKVEPETKK